MATVEEMYKEGWSFDHDPIPAETLAGLRLPLRDARVNSWSFGPPRSMLPPSMELTFSDGTVLQCLLLELSPCLMDAALRFVAVELSAFLAAEVVEEMLDESKRHYGNTYGDFDDFPFLTAYHGIIRKARKLYAKTEDSRKAQDLAEQGVMRAVEKLLDENLPRGPCPISTSDKRISATRYRKLRYATFDEFGNCMLQFDNDGMWTKLPVASLSSKVLFNAVKKAAERHDHFYEIARAAEHLGPACARASKATSEPDRKKVLHELAELLADPRVHPGPRKWKSRTWQPLTDYLQSI